VEYDVSIRVACEVLSISTTCYFYKPTLVNENAEINDWLKRLTTTHKRWGLGLYFASCAILKGLNGTVSACTVSIGSLSSI
jgi:putative transposase